MTLKELSRVWYLRREIEDNRARLYELESRAYSPRSPGMSGMPHGAAVGDPVSSFAAEIADLKALICEKQLACVREWFALELYISAIPESYTRLIFRFRFEDCLSWEQVARKIGGGNTADSVKKHAYRYLKSEKNGKNAEK